MVNLQHPDWGIPGYRRSQRKNISLFALQLPLSASLASNSSEGLVALFSHCILSLSAAVFEGKGSVLLPVQTSGTLGPVQNLLIYGTKYFCHNHSPYSWLSPGSDPNLLYLLELLLPRETLTNFAASSRHSFLHPQLKFKLREKPWNPFQSRWWKQSITGELCSKNWRRQ